MNTPGETKGETKRETKGETNANNPHSNSSNDENDTIVFTYLSTRLLHPVATDEPPPCELIAWWKIIFSYLGIKKMDQLKLQSTIQQTTQAIHEARDHFSC